MAYCGGAIATDMKCVYYNRSRMSSLNSSGTYSEVERAERRVLCNKLCRHKAPTGFFTPPTTTNPRPTPPYSSTVLPFLSVPTHPGSLIPIDSNSEGSSMNHASGWIDDESTNQRGCLFDMLPDAVLLAVFDFCVVEDLFDPEPYDKQAIEAWLTLVHVCWRWRSIVFGSPRRLDLRLVCSGKTPARDVLDTWPALPLVIWCNDDYPIENVDNIVAVLERNERVRQIYLSDLSNFHLSKIRVAMQEPFPELTHLELLLNENEKTVAVLPDSFLGGSAPCLEALDFDRIPFPGLPKLLSSAAHLVHLFLHDIPHSGYFSPETMATALSTSTRLEYLLLQFQSPRSCPDWATRRPPPQTRFVLRFLKKIWFRGVSEYLDDLVARINVPGLFLLDIIFFNQIIFDTPQVIQFISRTLMLKPMKVAHVIFDVGTASVNIFFSSSLWGKSVKLDIACGELDWQVSSLEQVCTWCLPPLSMLEDLRIYGDALRESEKQDNIENALWLELLQPFTTVKNLYLSEGSARRIAPALQELAGGRMTEVLPTLENIFLEGLQTGTIRESIWQFVATRQAIRLMTVSNWDGSGEIDD